MTVGLAEGYAWSVGSLNITPIGYVLVTLISVSIALMVHRRLKNNGELRLASRALGGGAEERIVAAAVDEVARIVTSTLEIREVYREFGNELSKLVDCDRLAIMTVDQDAGTMEFKYVYGEPSSRHYEGEVVCMENTRTKAVVETGQTHVWTDTNDEPHFRINDAPPDPELKAGITTPLVSNGRIVGVMNLRSGRAGAYGPKEQAIVTRLAVQIGPAVENAELFENAKRAEEEIRRLSEETAVIDAVAKIVTSTLDIQDVYEEFAQNLRQLVDLDTVVISVIDVEAGTLEHKYGYGEMRDRYKVGAILALEGTRTADVLATGQTLVLGDTPDDFRFSRDADNFKAGLRASINTPLVYRGQIFGMLYLRSKKKGAFGPREQAIVERLANQISPAVRNAQLYEDSRQLYADHMRLAEVNSSMVEIGRIIGSSLDISEVYEGVYQEMEKLVPFDRIVINLANVDRGTLNKSYMSGSGVAQKDVGHVFQIATSFSGQAIMHGVTQVCDPSNEADLDGHLSSLLPHFRAGLRSFLAVPLVSSGVAIGTMRLNSTTPNAYTKEVVGIVERIASVIAPALENSLMHNQQKKSLEEKEVLLKEINHRVKNNLQIISSLLNLQSRDIEDERVLQSIRAGQDRIGAMAMVHEKLYQSADLARIDFGEYIKSLAANLVSSYGLGSQNVDLKVDVEEILLGVDEAIPCGVIVNEMVSNSLKHAFPGDRPGTIVVSFREVGDDYTMVFKDDGVGLPEGLDVSCPSSLGWTIVNALIGQLRGSIELGSNGGCEVKISFPKR